MIMPLATGLATKIRGKLEWKIISALQISSDPFHPSDCLNDRSALGKLNNIF